MANKTYRQREWEPACSGPTELSLFSYVEDYQRAGYETDLRHEHGVVRLYVQAKPKRLRNDGELSKLRQ